MDNKIKNLKIYKALVASTLAATLTLVSIEGCSKKGVDSIPEYETNGKKDIKSEIPKVETPDIETPDIEKKDTNIINQIVYPKNTYGYIKQSVKLKNKPNGKKINKKLRLYEKVKLIKKVDNWLLVKYDNKKGYVKDINITQLYGEFVDIDIKSQRLRLYNNEGKLELKTSIVSGTDTSSERKSDRGVFEVFYKATDKYLKGPGYSSHVNYFAAYNNGEGMHDASWRSSFGGSIYKYNGSHGCINLPPSVAPKVYKRVKIGTKVLVHD